MQLYFSKPPSGFCCRRRSFNIVFRRVTVTFRSRPSHRKIISDMRRFVKISGKIPSKVPLKKRSSLDILILKIRIYDMVGIK